MLLIPLFLPCARVKASFFHGPLRSNPGAQPPVFPVLRCPAFCYNRAFLTPRHPVERSFSPSLSGVSFRVITRSVVMSFPLWNSLSGRHSTDPSLLSTGGPSPSRTIRSSFLLGFFFHITFQTRLDHAVTLFRRTLRVKPIYFLLYVFQSYPLPLTSNPLLPGPSDLFLTSVTRSAVEHPQSPCSGR